MTFDPVSPELTGSPAPVVQGIVSNNGPGGAQYSFSENGTLTYVSGTVEITQVPSGLGRSRRRLVFGALGHRGRYGAPALSPDGKRLALSVLRDDNWDVWVYDLEREVATRLTFYDGYDADQFWSHDGQYLFFSSDRDGDPVPTRSGPTGPGRQSL